MTKVEILKLQKKVASKMMAAIAMLLIASIMMVGVTYAWMSISTAPEAQEISTTVGGNGYLEIALAGTTVENEITQPDEPLAAGRRSSVESFGMTRAIANTYWGNIIDLGRSYGLENISLFPSRLALSTGLDNTVLVDSPLRVPEYGQDGRIKSMTGVQKAAYDPYTETYSLDQNYGVHLLGFFADGEHVSDDEEESIERISRQGVVDTMSANMWSARDDIRDAVVAVVEDHSRDILRILVELDFSMGTHPPFTVETLSNESAAAIVDMVNRLDTISGQALDSLRYAVMASCAADTTHYPNTDAGNIALGTLYSGFSQMTTDSMAQIATDNGYTSITSAVNSINEVKNKITLAKRYVNEDGNTAAAATLLFNITTTSLGGQTGMNIFSALDAMGQTSPHEADMYTWISGSVISIVPGMASIVGDYSALIQAYVDFSEVKNDTLYADPTTFDTPYGPMTYAQLYNAAIVPMAGDYTVNMYNTMGSSAAAYSEANNKGYLSDVYDVTSSATVDGEIMIVSQVAVKKSAYGYSFDLAFRSNEAGSLRLLQTGVDRIAGGAEDKGAMGAGSTVSFKSAADVTDPEALLESLYIVFMDTKEGTIYAIAAVDPDTVTTNAAGRVEGALKLYSPSVSNGVITKGNEKSTIVNLEADRTRFVTALVYLNGDAVTSGMLSSSGSASMNGTINLQFGTSATLVPTSSYNLAD